MPDTARLLDAVHTVTSQLSKLGDMDVVLRDVLANCVEAVGAEGGTIYLHDPMNRKLKFSYVQPDEVASRLERGDIDDSFGTAGIAFQTESTILSRFRKGGDPQAREISEKAGVTAQTMLTAPLRAGLQRPIGVIQLVNKRHGEFNETDKIVVETISDVSALALLYSRLVAQSRRIASLEGMGRAAHDLANKAGVLVTFLPDFRRNLNGLRTALDEGDAGAARLHLELLDGTFTDVFEPYSDRVFRYARLVNDLAAGKRLEPRKRLQPLADVIESGVSYLATPARDKHIDIVLDLQPDAPDFEFDELYMIRILENLVGNAVKAACEVIPDEWLAVHGADEDAIFDQVLVRYRFHDGCHIVEVIDHGPGMSKAAQERILAGDARVGWERERGSGLGTKVVLDLAVTHDGVVSIDSEPGQGTVFRVAFPHVCPQEDRAVVGAGKNR